MPDAYQIKDQSAIYFLTFQVVNWADIFSRKRYRDIIIDSLNFCVNKKGLNVFSWVIMTNHLHCLLSANNNNLSDIIRDFKGFTSKEILNSINEEPESRKEWLLSIFSRAAASHKRNESFQIWTHENHAVELESSWIDARIDYIHENPVRAGIVDNPEDYIYSSARDFCGNKGLVRLSEI